MAIFAEGTRLTEAKLKASVEHARSKGLPELKHHLLPRSRGFALTVQYFKDKGENVTKMLHIFSGDSNGPLKMFSSSAWYWLLWNLGI